MRLRRRALGENEIDLRQLLLLTRSFEISDAQASGIEKKGVALSNAVTKPGPTDYSQNKTDTVFTQKRGLKRKRMKYPERNMSKQRKLRTTRKYENMTSLRSKINTYRTVSS